MHSICPPTHPLQHVMCKHLQTPSSHSLPASTSAPPQKNSIHLPPAQRHFPSPYTLPFRSPPAQKVTLSRFQALFCVPPAQRHRLLSTFPPTYPLQSASSDLALTSQGTNLLIHPKRLRLQQLLHGVVVVVQHRLHPHRPLCHGLSSPVPSPSPRSEFRAIDLSTTSDE